MKNEVEKMLSIHMTDLCNNKCIFCIVDSPSQKKNFVNKERVFSFLKDNQDQGYAAVNLHGGESTTRKDFFEILQAINDCNYPKIILQTNARKFSKQEYAEKANQYGITKVVVSIHGSSSEIHDKITQVPGSLKHAVKGIRNIKKLGIHVRTNSVVSELNYKDFPSIIKLLLNLKVDHINISAIHTAGLAYKNFEIVTPYYKDIFPYVKEAVMTVVNAGVALTMEGFPFCMIPGWNNIILNGIHKNSKCFFVKIYLKIMKNIWTRICAHMARPV